MMCIKAISILFLVANLLSMSVTKVIVTKVCHRQNVYYRTIIIIIIMKNLKSLVTIIIIKCNRENLYNG